MNVDWTVCEKHSQARILILLGSWTPVHSSRPWWCIAMLCTWHHYNPSAFARATARGWDAPVLEEKECLLYTPCSSAGSEDWRQGWFCWWDFALALCKGVEIKALQHLELLLLNQNCSSLCTWTKAAVAGWISLFAENCLAPLNQETAESLSHAGGSFAVDAASSQGDYFFLGSPFLGFRSQSDHCILLWVLGLHILMFFKVTGPMLMKSLL